MPTPKDPEVCNKIYRTNFSNIGQESLIGDSKRFVITRWLFVDKSISDEVQFINMCTFAMSSNGN